MYLLKLGLFFLLVKSVVAGIEVTDVRKSKGANPVIEIHFKGDLKEFPDLNVTENTIDIVLFDASISMLSKTINIGNSLFEIKKEVAADSSEKLKIVPPRKYQFQKEKVSFNIKDTFIEVSVPTKLTENSLNHQVSEGIVSSRNLNVSQNENKKTTNSERLSDTKKIQKIIDEKFLEDLIAEENQKNQLAKNTAAVQDLKIEKSDSDKNQKSDIINVQSSATKDNIGGSASLENSSNDFQSKNRNKTPDSSSGLLQEPKTKSQFSLGLYFAKFFAVFLLIVAFFFGLVQLIKKGVFKNSKLNFLGQTKIIEVLSSHYVAPKRSLIMVRAHKQIFLLSSTEQGLGLISEIKDTIGLLKEGEKQISGSNFDDNYNEINLNQINDENFKLKDLSNISDLTKNEEERIQKERPVDKVKFSDQLKAKMKSLRPMH